MVKKKQMIKRTFFVLVMILFSVTTWGTKLHVSPSGNDGAGDGSAGSPYATVAGANTHASEGDTIVLLTSGTITETAQTSFAVGISLMSTEGTTITSNTTLNPIFRFVSASGNAVAGNQFVKGINFDGNETTVRRAIDIYYRGNVTVEDCTFTGFLYNGVRWHGTTAAWNVTPSNTLPTGNKMINCVFENCTQYTGSGETGHVRISGQSGFEWRGGSLTQYNADRDAGENRDLAGGYQNYGLNIIGVTWTKEDTNGTGWNFFAEFHYSHGGFYMNDCTFNGAACFDLSGTYKGTYNYGGLIEDCTFTTSASPVATDHDEPYLDLESFDYENDVIVRRCYFNNSRTAIKIANTQISANNIDVNYCVFNNVGNVTNAYSNGILIQSNWADASGIPMSNISIRNCVFDAGQPSYSGLLISAWGDLTDIRFQNNIVNGAFARPVRVLLNGGTPTIDSLLINKNYFYGNTSTDISYAGSITYTNRDDSGNTVANPLFISSSDFRLQDESPCINAGMELGLTTDFRGYSIKGLPDIGAYEWGSGVTVKSGSAGVFHNGKFVLNNL